jgi:hypothetical protein
MDGLPLIPPRRISTLSPSPVISTGVCVRCSISKRTCSKGPCLNSLGSSCSAWAPRLSRSQHFPPDGSTRYGRIMVVALKRHCKRAYDPHSSGISLHEIKRTCLSVTAGSWNKLPADPKKPILHRIAANLWWNPSVGSFRLWSRRG